MKCEIFMETGKRRKSKSTLTELIFLWLVTFRAIRAFHQPPGSNCGDVTLHTAHGLTVVT